MKKGYVIRNQYQEMISHVVVGNGYCSWGWTLLPDFAKVYKTEKLAFRDVKLVDSGKYFLHVLSFVETSSQYLVGESGVAVGQLAQDMGL